MASSGISQRHDGGHLRRQQQLVRSLGTLAVEDLRAPGCPADERRAQEVAVGRPRAFDRSPESDARHLQSQRTGQFLCARFCRRCRRRSKRGITALVDVRSPQEFTGEILAPPGLPETCQRGGHIPGARSIPWGKACNDDGTFKSADELKALYGARGHRRIKAGDRLLPHRRAIEPHVVRAEVPARVRQGHQLRWFLDRVGKSGGRAGGEGSGGQGRGVIG